MTAGGGWCVWQFVYPALWIVSRPNIDKNGEEGTISAGNYQKGDSAVRTSVCRLVIKITNQRALCAAARAPSWRDDLVATVVGGL